MSQREIVGPQQRFERSGAQRLRDIRPISTRLWSAMMSEFSGVMLASGAMLMFVEPALVNIVTPASFLYAGLVLTRRVTLPLRMPRTARMRDWNHPSPKGRRPRMAEGSIHLGRDVDGRELWIAFEDGRQHATVPGTTGAGKTTALLSFLANALTHASGFVIVDGKADNKLYGEVLALARRFGREDDVLCLNFMVASGVKDSNRFNPFAVGNADAIGEMLSSLLGEPAPGDANGVFRERAVALVGTLTPVLVWMRDHKNVPLNIETIRLSFELRSIWKVATKRVFEVRNPMTGETTDIPVPEMPEDLIYPLQAYLGELPSYDMSLDWNRQKTEEPSKQHGFAQFYFTHTFQLLGVSLGHIFKVRQSDVDMRDVVLNRRILVVNLPALESSDERLAALGKIVVASLRGMMAQMLGARLEGDSDVIVANKPGMGVAPFHVVLDEVGYYATSGMDRMLAQGRGLNLMFWLGFQEVSGIWARLGEKTQSLLGNGNLTVAMRQQDANRTREWIESTAGKAYVTQATSYEGGGTGEYAESRSAEVREVAGVEWRDLQSLIEGEAIILFGGRRIHAKLFHADIDPRGPMRLNRPVVLAPPDAEALKASTGPVTAALERLERGLGAARGEKSATLAAMLQAFAEAAAAGRPGSECVEAAIEAAGRAPLAAEEIAALAPRAPLQAMLRAAASRPPKAPSTPAPRYSGEGGPAEETRALLESVEIAAGGSPAEARHAAAAVLGGGHAIEAGADLRGAAEEEVARSIRTLIGEMASAAREAVAEASAKEAASPRLSGAIR
ncbi:intracellular multiplication protein IcmO [Roseiarcus fermentans]|uniref:Intracellular multiplication protein IcmO n=1 Tax=Roseiarcus fermentans TaxID=1473586 RepID=A0A366FGM4_9HYPH|nr:TraM recognition domain-containing protein [Roseiarcus fermentans]RBP13110.1 intracellular multiplication protein IcmO [Roseiarcus fermentans]